MDVFIECGYEFEMGIVASTSMGIKIGRSLDESWKREPAKKEIGSHSLNP
jgi:hypothetical protein